MNVPRSLRLVSLCLSLAVGASWALTTPAQAQERAKNVTFDDIKLDLKKDEPFKRKEHLTEKVEKLDGTKIKIRGWIHPYSAFTATGLKEFILVRDNQECCFGPGAALHDCIRVQMVGGASTEYTTRPIAVEGVFSVSEYKGPDGKQLAIYKLEGTSAK